MVCEGSDRWRRSGCRLVVRETPWGGTLQLKMQMHPDLPTSDISYFRWSYKFATDSNLTHVKAPYTIRKQKITYIPPNIVIIHNTPVTFVTQTVGSEPDLFAIPDPKSLPSDTSWIDFPYGNFDSTLGASATGNCNNALLTGKSGLCTLKLEMFSSAGKHVASDNLGGLT